jgi:hypothetical protein
MLTDYDVLLETSDGRQVLRARGRQPESGFRVTLTFPAEPASDGLEPFKARIVRLILGGGHGDGRGCDLPGVDREAGQAGW